MTALAPYPDRSFQCWNLNRYVILIVAGLHLSAILSSVITFNASFVPMQDLQSSPLYEAYINGTLKNPDWSSSELPLSDRRFVWTPVQKSLSFASAFCGVLIGAQPLRYLTRKFGAHKSGIVIGVLSTLAVSFSPIIVATWFPLFLAVRFLNGLTFCNLFTVSGVVTNTWASLSEQGIFVAVLTGHVEISALYAMPVGGAVASTAGWPAFFYLTGGITALTTVMWAFFYRDRVEDHPFVGEAEYKTIIHGKTAAMTSGRIPKPPLRAIFTDPVIWSAWIATIGTFFVCQYSITWIPVYLNKVLGYSISSAGVINAIPLFFQLFIKFFSGFLSDKLTCIKEVLKLRVFNSLALAGSALFYTVINVVPPTGSWIDVVLAVAPIALLGFHAGGYPKCIVLVSRQHSAFVMSIVQMVACATMLCGSFLVPIYTPGNTFEEWTTIYTFYAVLLIISNTIFLIFARAEPAEWTKSTSKVGPVEASIENGSGPDGK